MAAALKDMMPKDLKSKVPKVPANLKSKLPNMSFKAPANPFAKQGGAGGASGAGGGQSPGFAGGLTKGRCLGGLGLALGAVCVAVGVWATSILTSKVYEDLDCKHTGFDLKKFSISSLELELNLKGECNNPNPYGIRIESGGTGKVYTNRERTETVSSVVVNNFDLPEKGVGKADADVSVKFPSASLLTSTGDIEFFLESTLTPHASMTFFGKQHDFTQQIDLKCKVVLTRPMAYGIPTGMPKYKTSACVDDWAKIDDAGGMAVEDMAQTMIKEAEKAKNGALGLVAGLGYGMGLLFSVLGAVTLWQTRPEDNNDDRPDEEKPAPSPPTSTMPKLPSPATIGKPLQTMGQSIKNMFGTQRGKE